MLTKQEAKQDLEGLDTAQRDEDRKNVICYTCQVILNLTCETTCKCHGEVADTDSCRHCNNQSNCDKLHLLVQEPDHTRILDNISIIIAYYEAITLVKYTKPEKGAMIKNIKKMYQQQQQQ